MATSLSSSSSSSSSLPRFWPLFSAESASFMAWSAVEGGLVGSPWAAAPGTGALKMLCWSSVTWTFVDANGLANLKVPSSLAIVLDFVLAYSIFFRGGQVLSSVSHALARADDSVGRTRDGDGGRLTSLLPKKSKSCRERMACVDACMSRNTIWAWPRILVVLSATTSSTGPYVENSM